MQIAAAGRHVITEKPMATRWADGKRMVEPATPPTCACSSSSRTAATRTLQMLKRAVEHKRFGRIYMVNLNVFWSRPQSYYDSAKWRGTWEFDGGALMNQASHYVDLLDWLIGPVESVQAYTATLARDIQVEDTAVVRHPLALRRAGLDERDHARPIRRTTRARSPSSARRAPCASAAWR